MRILLESFAEKMNCLTLQIINILWYYAIKRNCIGMDIVLNVEKINNILFMLKKNLRGHIYYHIFHHIIPKSKHMILVTTD